MYEYVCSIESLFYSCLFTYLRKIPSHGSLVDEQIRRLLRRLDKATKLSQGLVSPE